MSVDHARPRGESAGADARCVIAIDGPAGSGKSTISRRVAKALGGRYLDTGAMYRGATWAVLREGADPHDSIAVEAIVRKIKLTMGTDPDASTISVDGVCVDGPIRGPEVTAAVSAVSAVAAVREILVATQKEIIADSGRIVVEGRDIARVVAPDADLKVFLTASAAERARRRGAETATDVAATAEDLARRDRLDSTRAIDPLRQAEDAYVLDTTDLGIDEVVNRLLRMLDV